MAIISEKEILLGFLIGEHNINNIKYADCPKTISEMRMERKDYPSDFKMAEFSVIQMRSIATSNLQIGDVKNPENRAT